MGLAASQARLLTITSRLSSVELKQQRIAMDKMRLANDQQGISEKYTNALNNKTLSFTNGTDSVPMTYDELLSRGYSVARASDGVVASASSSSGTTSTTSTTANNTTNSNTKNANSSNPEIQKWVGKEAPVQPTFSETQPTQPSQKLSQPSKTIQTTGSVTVPDFSAQLTLAQKCKDTSYNWNSSNSWSGGLGDSMKASEAKSLQNSLSNSLQGLINNLYSANLKETGASLEKAKKTADSIYQAANMGINSSNYGSQDMFGNYTTPENVYGKTIYQQLIIAQSQAQNEANSLGPVTKYTTNPNYEAELSAYNANQAEWTAYNTQKAEYDKKYSDYTTKLDQYNIDYNNWQIAYASSTNNSETTNATTTATSSATPSAQQTLADQLRQSSDFLIQGLLSGYLVLMKNGQQVSMSSATDVIESYDKTDDAAAEAEYNSQMAKINSKEKILDMQAKRLDTEYSALTTEYESVKNIISNHTSKDFSYFS